MAPRVETDAPAEAGPPLSPDAAAVTLGESVLLLVLEKRPLVIMPAVMFSADWLRASLVEVLSEVEPAVLVRLKWFSLHSERIYTC